MRKLCLQMRLVVWVFSKKSLQMIAESLLVYISQLDLEYMMVTNYLILFCTGNQCNNLRSSLESCLRSFLNTSLAALF